MQDQGPAESQDCLSLYISILSVEAGVTLKIEKTPLALYVGLSIHSLTRSKKNCEYIK